MDASDHSDAEPRSSSWVRAWALLRPHFFPLSASATLAGAATQPAPRMAPVVVATLIGAVGWAVGQVLNDLADEGVDDLVAPRRAGARRGLGRRAPLLGALVVGAGLAVACLSLHAMGWVVALLAAGAMLLYSSCKRFPLLGNFIFAMLPLTAALLGALAGRRESFATCMWDAAPVLVWVGGWSLLYVQHNYEKDRSGDAAAGYVTLARVLPLRLSAALRFVGGLALLGWAAAGPLDLGLGYCWALAALLSASTVWVGVRGTEESALCTYRFSIYLVTAAALTVAAPLLGTYAVAGFALVTLLVTEAAMWRFGNP